MNIKIREFILAVRGANWIGTRGWFKDGHVNVYLRHGRRMIGSEITLTLDIASVEVTLRGKGHFTRFLTELEKFVDDNRPLPIYIENVAEKRFQGFFRRREGYVQNKIPHCPDVCFIRPVLNPRPI